MKDVDETNSNSSLPILKFLVGNKIDKADYQVISSEKGERYASQIEAEFFEVSAKENTGILEVFERCACKLHERENAMPTREEPSPSVVIKKYVEEDVKANKKKNCKC